MQEVTIAASALDWTESDVHDAAVVFARHLTA
jgi:hypothetical protein